MPLLGLENLIGRLSTFSMEDTISSIISENADILLFLLKKQLAAGKDGNGDFVTLYGNAYYHELTVNYKLEFGVGLGAQTDWITNYMHGAFYESLYVIQNGNKVIITSDLDYFDKIIDRSGSIIMKLSKESMNVFKKEIIEPQLKIKMKSYGF